MAKIPTDALSAEIESIKDGSVADDEPLSRTDRFFITSMLIDEHPSPVGLSEETIIGGSTLNSIMELGRSQLCSDVKLKDAFASMQLTCLLNLQNMAWDCFRDALKNKNDFTLRDINLTYGYRAIDTFIQLYDRLEKQNSIRAGERILSPLTANTLIEGVTLRQIMEWARVEPYLELKPQNPCESMLADLVVRANRAAWDCSEQAVWKRHHPNVREMNLKCFERNRYFSSAYGPLAELSCQTD